MKPTSMDERYGGRLTLRADPAPLLLEANLKD